MKQFKVIYVHLYSTSGNNVLLCMQVGIAFSRDTASVQITDMMNNVVDDQRLAADSANRELQYRGAPGDDILYWSLPSQFLGDKVTAYGGSLRFSLRYSSRSGRAIDRDEPLVKIAVS